MVVALVLLSAVGLWRAVGERYVVVLNRHHWRPLVLQFGPKVGLGGCVAQESDDPASDVLANQVDVDGDGHPDYRFTADYEGVHPTCEVRRAGLWLAHPLEDCERAILRCRR